IYLSAVARNLVQIIDFSKDPLTGLLLRRFFIQELQNLLQSGKSQLVPLVFMDIDHFKLINDTYGHGAGDAVLSTLPHVLGLRATDVIGRWGGEEILFALNPQQLRGGGRRLKESLTPEIALDVISRVKRRIEQYEFPEVGRITCSFGVSLNTQVRKDPYSMIELADALLYLAKRAGRNRIALSTSDTINKEELHTLKGLKKDDTPTIPDTVTILQ
ncbi:MAG: GGDEF domain-containing protein, partial [Candidatus ainarchaeum sp.]|nr:GGDEF domain-containing protein [Candidatus ainarchaeum sp.]